MTRQLRITRGVYVTWMTYMFTHGEIKQAAIMRISLILFYSVKQKEPVIARSSRSCIYYHEASGKSILCQLRVFSFRFFPWTDKTTTSACLFSSQKRFKNIIILENRDNESSLIIRKTSCEITSVNYNLEKYKLEMLINNSKSVPILIAFI